MQTKPSTQKHYKIFDQSIAIKQAQELIDQTKKKLQILKSIRIDSNTIVQVEATRSNAQQIADRVKRKTKTISIIEQIEYGQYA